MLVDKASTNLFFDFERAHLLDNVYSYMFSSPLLCINKFTFWDITITEQTLSAQLLGCGYINKLSSRMYCYATSCDCYLPCNSKTNKKIQKKRKKRKETGRKSKQAK